MEYATTRSTAKRALLASLALIIVMLAIFAGNASAQEVRFAGLHLGGKTWTCGKCVLQGSLDLTAAWANTTSSVCTGPVTYNGSWHMPYGWSCESERVNGFSFPAVSGFAAIYNPNAGTFGEYEFVGFG